jgi:hypothetical protein
MSNKTNQLLDDLLYRWHERCLNYKIAAGYPDRASGCKDHRASRQYDGETTTHSDSVDDNQTAEFDVFMNDKVYTDRPMYFAALCQDAKNIYAGGEAFRQPKLPRGEEGKAIVQSARKYAADEFLGV